MADDQIHVKIRTQVSASYRRDESREERLDGLKEPPQSLARHLNDAFTRGSTSVRDMLDAPAVSRLSLQQTAEAAVSTSRPGHAFAAGQ